MDIISAKVGSLLIYYELIPDFLAAESKIYLLKASIIFRGAFLLGSVEKTLKYPSEHPA